MRELHRDVHGVAVTALTTFGAVTLDVVFNRDPKAPRIAWLTDVDGSHNSKSHAFVDDARAPLCGAELRQAGVRLHCRSRSRGYVQPHHGGFRVRRRHDGAQLGSFGTREEAEAFLALATTKPEPGYFVESTRPRCARCERAITDLAREALIGAYAP